MTRGGGAALGVAALAALAGCGDLQGFGGPTPPLVTFNVMVNGDLPAGASVTSLQVALVWGAQWQTEPFCILPPEAGTNAATVIDEGCRKPFSFVPALVAANVPVEIGVPTTLSLSSLPSADVMVGDITSRIAYGSLVVYDDRDNTGTLDLASPHRTPRGGRGADEERDTQDSPDVVYGASFVTMIAPDQRVSFLEGTFTQSAFYPRVGCPAPMAKFRVLSAGGFIDADPLMVAMQGQLPMEDPARCDDQPPEAATISITLQAPAQELQEVSCVEPRNDSSVRYREPPSNGPDFSGRQTACPHLPTFEAGDQPDLLQLVVTGRPQDRCVGLTHYTLRGCRENVACPVPDWDFTANPPAWWPCQPS